ncbi:MAG: hypothetical protein NC489_29180 [Ruminococcus flavefaciens]|nr:hypothetical protein [Ruminococcus flavefaciens]
MKVIEANEGQKISYTAMGNWLNIGDQIMLNLEKMESDKAEHRDISADAFGKLQTGEGLYYVAQIDIPAREYTETEIKNPDYDPDASESGESGGMGNSETIIKRDPVPFSMENVTLTLYALKEGVF